MYNTLEQLELLAIQCYDENTFNIDKAVTVLRGIDLAELSANVLSLQQSNIFVYQFVADVLNNKLQFYLSENPKSMEETLFNDARNFLISETINNYLKTYSYYSNSNDEIDVHHNLYLMFHSGLMEALFVNHLENMDSVFQQFHLLDVVFNLIGLRNNYAPDYVLLCEQRLTQKLKDGVEKLYLKSNAMKQTHYVGVLNRYFRSTTTIWNNVKRDLVVFLFDMVEMLTPPYSLSEQSLYRELTYSLETGYSHYLSQYNDVHSDLILLKWHQWNKANV